MSQNLRAFLRRLESFTGIWGLEINSRFLERDLRGIEELVGDFEGEALLLDLYRIDLLAIRRVLDEMKG